MGQEKVGLERLDFMMKKIRIMFAMGGSMKRAGAETMIMQYLRQLIKDEQFEFSFLIHGMDKGDYDEEILSYGIPIYHVPVRGRHPFIYRKAVKKVLREHPVDIIHCNMDYACGEFLSIAKEVGIKGRIAHSHTTKYLTQSPIKRIFEKLSKRKIHSVATTRISCSDAAGKWLFGNDEYILINNAIDLESYKENIQKRKELRAEWGADEDTLILGHVGNFTYPKNHSGLVKLFAALKKQRANSKLVLVGTGALMQEIKSLVQELKLSDDVMFLGKRSDVPNLLQAFDVFVMPSNFEGLPVSGVEAQAAGLPCLFSNHVTKEICMTKLVRRLPLEKTNEWIDALISIHGQRDYEDARLALRKYGFDIDFEADKLADCYRNLYSTFCM
jgi:glycosyltransferase involved in cell wall biosynthesis